MLKTISYEKMMDLLYRELQEAYSEENIIETPEANEKYNACYEALITPEEVQA